MSTTRRGCRRRLLEALVARRKNQRPTSYSGVLNTINVSTRALFGAHVSGRDVTPSHDDVRRLLSHRCVRSPRLASRRATRIFRPSRARVPSRARPSRRRRRRIPRSARERAREAAARVRCIVSARARSRGDDARLARDDEIFSFSRVGARAASGTARETRAREGCASATTRRARASSDPNPYLTRTPRCVLAAQ